MRMEHLEAGCGGFDALVAVYAAGAGFGLFGGVAGEHAEDDGHAVFDAHLGDAVGGGLGDELEVARLALDDASEADDGVDFIVGVEQHGGGGGELETAGHIINEEVGFGHAAFQEGLYGAFFQRIRDAFVPLTNNNANFEIGIIGGD